MENLIECKQATIYGAEGDKIQMNNLFNQKILAKKAEEEVDLSKHNLFERRKALDKQRKTRKLHVKNINFLDFYK